MQDDVVTLFAYDRWANRKVLDACRKLTAEQYVAQRFWESASLPPCPMHPEGGCGFARHTPYERTKALE